MKDIVNHFLSGTFGSMWRRHQQADETGRIDEARVTTALEQVVEGTDPAIRYVRGYRKKLFGPVVSSLEYADHVVASIPGAVEVSRRNFVSDPYVNAFFVNTQDLQLIFSHSSEVREFLEECGSNLNGCYALLCMHRSEKTVFGVELEGDLLRRDVQQTAVSFSDHRIYSPAATEEGAREGLKQCLFHGLGNHALGRIMQLKVENHHLQQEHHDLNVRLRRLTSSGKEARDAGDVLEVERTGRRLKEIEQALLHSRVAAPEESLRQVQDVLAHPDDFVRVQHTTLRLNRMCIKVDEHSSQPFSTVRLTEVTFGEDAPRVVTLAKFPGDELLPAGKFLDPECFA